MTQKTVEKMRRALEAMNIAAKSFSRDVVESKDSETRKAYYENYTEMVNLMTAYRAFINKVETVVWRNEQKAFDEALDKAVARWEMQG